MTAQIDHTNLHRTAKYFMDSGRAKTAIEAINILRSFGLTIYVGAEAAESIEGQIALLTLVNLARRTMLAGVEVIGLPDVTAVVRLTDARKLRDAVKELGGRCTKRARRNWPVAVIGSSLTLEMPSPSWQLVWDGWRGGVIPGRDAAGVREKKAIPLAPALAAAVCAAEVFAFHAGDHMMAGRRSAGFSLWSPGVDWRQSDASEPSLSFLPSRLWLIGLGNLGQAYAWLLACLPYRDPSKLEFMLQDIDRMAVSNDSTSLLASLKAVGRKKTRWVGAWLESKGFSTSIEERLFDDRTRRSSDEPGVALCGVDNALARASLENAGFDLIVEAGLGAGTQSFRSFALHCFPSSRTAAAIWTRDVDSAATEDLTAMPAYQDMVNEGVDECGLIQIATRTVGVPFVGLIAAALVVGELLRRLHGAPGAELISGSTASLQDADAIFGDKTIYAHGYVSCDG